MATGKCPLLTPLETPACGDCLRVDVDGILIFDKGGSPQVLLGHSSSFQYGAARHCYCFVAAIVNVDFVLVNDGNAALFDKAVHTEGDVCGAWHCVPLLCFSS